MDIIACFYTGQKKCDGCVLSHCPVHQHNTRAEGGDTATEAQAPRQIHGQSPPWGQHTGCPRYTTLHILYCRARVSHGLSLIRGQQRYDIKLEYEYFSFYILIMQIIFHLHLALYI